MNRKLLIPLLAFAVGIAAGRITRAPETALADSPAERSTPARFDEANDRLRKELLPLVRNRPGERERVERLIEMNERLKRMTEAGRRD